MRYGLLVIRIYLNPLQADELELVVPVEPVGPLARKK